MHRLAAPIFITLITTAAPAAAQLTLPPSPARPERPEYVPISERAEQNNQQNQNVNRDGGRANPATNFDPTSVEFEPIFTITADGEFISPNEHYEIAALRNNPLIDEELWEFVEVLLEEREAELEISAHQYANQAIHAVTTLIPNFDITKEETRDQLTEVTRVLTQPSSLVSWLAEQGVITQEMSTMSQHITAQYTTAMMNHIESNASADASREDITSMQARFLVKSGIAESLFAFGRLARKVIETHPDLVENPDELLAKEGREFFEAAAYALEPIDDERLNELFKEAYNN